MYDKLREECGVFGIYDVDGGDVAHNTYLALYALQHRGQESCGIAVNDDGVTVYHKDVGLVPDVFNEVILKHLSGGKIAIGHVRYATSAKATRENAQPLVMKYVKGTIALAHNGNLVNDHILREQLENNGAIFQTSIDSEVISYIMARERLKTHSIEDALLNSMESLKGAYSIVVMSPQKLIAARDPNGFRPLCLGKLGNSYVVASESCAIESIGAEFVRDIAPGEIVVIDKNGIKSIQFEKALKKSTICIFEYIYFARPDSVIEGGSVHAARKQAGRFLAQQHPVAADIVIGVPDSGLDAALGYSAESGIPYGVGLIKNRYIGRTFIEPTQSKREDAVRIKLNALKDTVRGKRVVMVDDSIVRGTTCGRIVSILRDAGATEVHMRVSSPPFLNPCYFGTDVASRENLIACRMSVKEIEKAIGVDSLGYLSIENLHKISPSANCNFCDGCFTGAYPIDVPKMAAVDKYDDDRLFRGSIKR